MRHFIVLILFFIPAMVKANFTWTDKCHQAYDCTLRLNFNKAYSLLAEEKKINPQNLIPVYIESQADFLKSFISEEDKSLQLLKDRNELRISQLEKDKNTSPFKQVCIAEMYIQIAIARLKFEEYLGAAYDIRKAYKLLEENQKNYPNFKPNLKSLGFMHAVIGTIPKNYSWVASMLGLSGTIKQGLGELKLLLDATTKQNELDYLHDETVVMLTFLEMSIGKDRNNEEIRKRFIGVNDIEQKPLLLFAKGVFHFSIGENDSVIYDLSRRKTEPGAFELSYLDFMEGSARLHNLDFSASSDFARYINNYKGKSYIKSAWQRLAWIKLLQNDLPGYKLCMSKCIDKTKSNDFADEDKQAIKEATNGETPNITLLRSRLLFDGGYYTRALAELAGKPISNFPRQKDQLEFTYRLARIFDKTQKDDKAIQFYEATIKNGETQVYYFAANSALQLGQLYEDRGNKPKAVEYYKKALSLRDHEYQNSIDQKAKSGLNRMGQ